MKIETFIVIYYTVLFAIYFCYTSYFSLSLHYPLPQLLSRFRTRFACILVLNCWVVGFFCCFIFFFLDFIVNWTCCPHNINTNCCIWKVISMLSPSFPLSTKKAKKSQKFQLIQKPFHFKCFTSGFIRDDAIVNSRTIFITSVFPQMLGIN